MASPRTLVPFFTQISRNLGVTLQEATQVRRSHIIPNRPCHVRSLSRRCLHIGKTRPAPAAAAQRVEQSVPDPSSNPPLSFPCLDAVESRSASLSASLSQRSSLGPEPSYTSGEHLKFHSAQPLLLDWGGVLQQYDIAYESWGSLNAERTNAILLHTGLSASSHAHSTDINPAPGWWQKFIGPGAPLDTDKYFIICTNVIGGCYGSTGPSSRDPVDGQRYATRFPILTMDDMVRAQFRLLDSLSIERLYASVGSSMGGMQSLAAGVMFPERVGRVASISGCARSHPYSIAMRHTQRQVLMVDPNWSRGFYYDKVPPHAGMKLAREIATVTYRSGPEWEQRFGRRRADPSRPPALCPDFLIETYLDHAGEKWCLEYDANSLLYISKAMDLFDLGQKQQSMIGQRRQQNESRLSNHGSARNAIGSTLQNDACTLTLPETPYEEQPSAEEAAPASIPSTTSMTTAVKSNVQPPQDLVQGLRPLSQTPTLVMGVASDILFPAWQQREIADTLRMTGNRSVTHIELGEDKSIFGHDTFLLDLENVGEALKTFLG